MRDVDGSLEACSECDDGDGVSDPEEQVVDPVIVDRDHVRLARVYQAVVL